MRSSLGRIIDLTSDFHDTHDVSHLASNGTNKPDQKPPVSDDAKSDSDDTETSYSLSLIDDIAEAVDEDQSLDDETTDGDACTREEASAYRTRLHAIGEDAFKAETVESKTISARKLMTAFGIKPPSFLEGSSERVFRAFLNHCIAKELSSRQKLPQVNTIRDVVRLLKNSNRIIVLTGAGISTSLGIPDFRSKNTGLYQKLNMERYGLTDPQDAFEISLFREDPSIFYSVAKDIVPKTTKFTPTHAFIRLLQEKGKLLTNYTQNIDNLEAHASISPDKLIQCHGSFATATCIKCRMQVKGDHILKDLSAGIVAKCPRCIKDGMQKMKNINGSRKRKFNDIQDDVHVEDAIESAGAMKPDITFFGEQLPDSFERRFSRHDRHRCDLLIVIGTSLKVRPVSDIIGRLPPDVPQVYISREPVPIQTINFDVDMLGDCDVVVAELCRRAGWDLNHEMIPPNQKVRVQLEEDFLSRYRFTVEHST
ncbi:MAG: NAD-dependent histone deacetylase sir2 [Cirrosporium novae-zelandiae]|nr:MAG: NAD-dependent histone deacetylase sir2 [Cirrosporium novae-zelandiae]